jgi:hypothetical protein
MLFFFAPVILRFLMQFWIVSAISQMVDSWGLQMTRYTSGWRIESFESANVLKC